MCSNLMWPPNITMNKLKRFGTSNDTIWEIQSCLFSKKTYIANILRIQKDLWVVLGNYSKWRR